MLIALCLDRLIGWPDKVYRRLSHPVVGIGRLIEFFDVQLNKHHWPVAIRYITGSFSLLLVITINAAAFSVVVFALPSGWTGTITTALIAWPFLAAKSLHSHVKAVVKSLQADDLPAARLAVSRIVGRNSEQLDQPAITRATVESLAENTSDGVVAPLFWGVLFGLPGLVVYKAINTADSMIGYRNDQYAAFGWASARLDDIVNIVPARLTGLIYALLAKAPLQVLKIMLKDAPLHRSWNAGWPESALAIALGIRLSGPRFYGGVVTTDPWLNGTGRDPCPEDILSALQFFNRLLWVVSCLLLSGAIYFFDISNGSAL